MAVNFTLAGIGRVSSVRDGKSKAGNAWLLANVTVRTFNFSAKKYEPKVVNCWFSGKQAEDTVGKIKEGSTIYFVGEPNIVPDEKQMKTNEGVIPTFAVRVDRWFDCSPRDTATPAKEDDSNPFDE